MCESDQALILWPLATEAFAAFFRRRLPAIMAAQSHSQSDQVKTLVLLASICDGLAARNRFLLAPDRTEITETCEKLSRHVLPALARLPRVSQLEYRRILKICQLAWRFPRRTMQASAKILPNGARDRSR